MAASVSKLWNSLRVRQKVAVIILGVFLPLLFALVLHVILAGRQITLQEQMHNVLLAREQVHILRRLSVDIEDAFRGYLLTRQEAFLEPMWEAEPKLRPTIDRFVSLAELVPGFGVDIQNTSASLNKLLESKHQLIQRVQAGHLNEVLQYVRSGKGLALSQAVLSEFRSIEDELDTQLRRLEIRQAGLVRDTFWGLLGVVMAAMALALVGTRLLASSMAEPIALLQSSVVSLGQKAGEINQEMGSIAIRSQDEIGQLARSFEQMASQIREYIYELETINAIGHEINMIEVGGLQGVLRRITDRAAALLQADVCLVMLRDNDMECWVVEAASGGWNDRLQKSVMLWEEFPVSVKAFETRAPAIGEDLRSDPRPEVVRRNLIGGSMLSVPLMSRGEPFGVLVLLQEKTAPQGGWNVRLAKGLADEAAVAIVNVRLYEAQQQKGRGLEWRIKQLEHMAVMLAHDLKGPGERMEKLATLVRAKYGDQLDARAQRWLQLVEEDGRELIARVENLLAVAKVGARKEPVEAVDPALAIEEVLKAKTGELEERHIRVEIGRAFPLMACHRAYLRQVFDNLIGNAIKFCGDQPEPWIRITCERKGTEAHVSVSDNGPGVPPQHREKVFQPFVRLQPDSTRGSGIGLTIVKRIVELYGGRVWIESNEPAGCTVTFTMPVLGDLTADPLPVRGTKAS
jgi:signal transduction histidine kinase/CHASE3 domain sensor protein